MHFKNLKNMKKTQLIVTAILAIAIIGLYVLHFCCNGKPVSNSPRGNTEFVESAADGSVVYIQIDSLVNGYDMFHDLRTEFDAKVKKADENLTRKGRAFESKAMDFQEKVQKGLITRSQAEELGAKLQQEQATLQQEAEKLRAEMAEEERVMLNKVYDAVTTFLKEYNKEHNYSLIISTNGSTNTIMPGSSASLDITKDVQNGLNAIYVRPKK